MWILCLEEDSLEKSSLIFSEKQWKKKIWMSSAAVVIGALRVNALLRAALHKREYLMIIFLISHLTIRCDPSSEPRRFGWKVTTCFYEELTFKVPNKNCSRRHFNFLLLSFEENKAWFFMWILCLAEDSPETSSLIFSEKQWKIFMNVVCCSRDRRFKGCYLIQSST